MLGRLYGSKREGSQLPSGRKTTKFAKLAIEAATPGCNRARGSLEASGTGAEHAQHSTPPPPPLAPPVRLADALGPERIAQSMQQSLVELDFLRASPFVFATDEEVRLSRWQPIFSARPRSIPCAFPPSSRPESYASATALFMPLIDRGISEYACETAQPSIPDLDLDLELSAYPGCTLADHEIPSLPPPRVQLAHIRSALACEASRAHHDSPAFKASMLSDAANSLLLALVVEHCADSAAEMSAHGYENAPTGSSVELLAEVDCSRFAPESQPMPLSHIEHTAFAFCAAMDQSAMRSQLTAELAGVAAAGERCELALSELELLSQRSELPHPSSPRTLGQYAVAQLTHELPALDEYTDGEVAPPSLPALELRSAHLLHEEPDRRLYDTRALARAAFGESSLRSSASAQLHVERWMAEDLYDDGKQRRVLFAPTFGELSGSAEYEVRARPRILSPSVSRLAASAQAAETCRERLLGVAPQQLPSSAPYFNCERIVERMLFDARLSGADPREVIDSLFALEIEVIAEAEPQASPRKQAVRTSRGESIGAGHRSQPDGVAPERLAGPHEPLLGSHGEDGIARDCRGSALPSATRTDGVEVASLGRMAQPHAIIRAQPAGPHDDQRAKLHQDDVIAHFMRLRGLEAPPIPPPPECAPAGGQPEACHSVLQPPARQLPAAQPSQAEDLSSPPPGQPVLVTHALQLVVGERMRTQRSASLISLASRVEFVDRGFWMPDFALSVHAAGIIVDAEELLSPTGPRDVLEELYLLAAQYTQCWLFVCCEPASRSVPPRAVGEELMHHLAQLVLAARSFRLQVVPLASASGAEMCDAVVRALEDEDIQTTTTSRPQLPLLDTAAERILSSFFNPRAAMHILSTPGLLQGDELASFLRLTTEQRRTRYPWLHPIGLAVMDMTRATAPRLQHRQAASTGVRAASLAPAAMRSSPAPASTPVRALSTTGARPPLGTLPKSSGPGAGSGFLGYIA